MKTARVTYHLRLDKLNQQTGEAPIYCRITVDGKRANFSINRSVDPQRWEQTNQLQKARKQEDRELSFYMDSIRARIKEIERTLIDSKTPITADNIKNAYSGKEEKSKSLIDVFEWHNRKFQDMVISDKASQGTLDRYTQVLKHLKEFLRYQFNKSDLYLSDLEYSFITQFDHYFRTKRRCNNNSTVKYIRNFRKIIKLAVLEGWLDYDPFVRYQGRVSQTKRDFLTPDEIEIIRNKNIPVPRLDTVRDIFLFSIFTGYAYAEVKKLSYSHIQRHIDGELWIFTSRTKTKVDENVMLLHPALELIDKYRKHPACVASGRLFPVPSNQKLNSYLKELADICGIKKNLTFHVARHSFATSIMLANNVPLETVMDTIGHRHIKQTQHYAKMLNSKVSIDMKKLNEKFKKPSGPPPNFSAGGN